MNISTQISTNTLLSHASVMANFFLSTDLATAAAVAKSPDSLYADQALDAPVLTAYAFAVHTNESQGW